MRNFFGNFRDSVFGCDYLFCKYCSRPAVYLFLTPVNAANTYLPRDCRLFHATGFRIGPLKACGRELEPIPMYPVWQRLPQRAAFLVVPISPPSYAITG